MTTLIRNVLALQGDALETLDILINHQKIEAVVPAGSTLKICWKPLSWA